MVRPGRELEAHRAQARGGDCIRGRQAGGLGSADAGLPGELVPQLREAAINGDFDRVLELIDQVEAHDPRLAQRMRSLAEPSTRSGRRMPTVGPYPRLTMSTEVKSFLLDFETLAHRACDFASAESVPDSGGNQHKEIPAQKRTIRPRQGYTRTAENLLYMTSFWKRRLKYFGEARR